MKKTYEIGHGLELSEEALDTAVELLEQYRGQFKIHEEHLPAAAVHAASRLEDEPRTEKMIFDYLEDQNHLFQSVSGSLERDVRKAVKKLRKKLDLSPVRSREHLEYLVSHIGSIDMEDEAVGLAESYCDTAEEYNGLSRSKVAIAGACLKQAVEETREDTTVTHTQLADITGMNEKTFEDNLAAIRETILQEPDE